MSDKNINVQLVWHLHQPTFVSDQRVSNHVTESYANLLDIHRDLEVPIALNVTGTLLSRFVEHHPIFLDKLLELSDAGIIEILGSGYNHPLLPLLGYDDAKRQIEADVEIKENIFDHRPSGFWPTDLAWSHWILPILSQLEFDWTIVDTPSLIESNSLPKWGTKERNQLEVLDPDLDSLVHPSELTEVYEVALADASVNALIRHRSLSEALFDTDTGIREIGKIKEYINKIKRSSYEGLLTIGGDGEQIDPTTCTNYRTLVSKLADDPEISITNGTAYLSRTESQTNKFLPATTFQYDFQPWIDTQEDKTYLQQLERVSQQLQLLEILHSLNDTEQVAEEIESAKTNLMKAQDSGCTFWKYHQQYRESCWEYLYQAYCHTQKGLNKL